VLVKLRSISSTIILIFVINHTLSAKQTDSQEKILHNVNTQVSKSLLGIISIDLDEVTFEQALSTIAEKGKFKLNYNRNRIPADKKVSVKMNNTIAIKALLKILNDTETGLKITKEGLLAILPATKSEGNIKGIIVERKSGKPLAGANVIIVGKTMGAATGPDGQFLISKLPMGVYTIEASMIGFKSKRIENIIITEEAAIKLHIELADTLLSLREIIVTPGHFSLMEKESASRNALKDEDIRSFPQIGDDIYRAVKRLPGLSGNDFSARFYVRGGEQDEVLVLLDGMELFDPFHLKDIDGALSIIDVEAIKGIDMMTGAFTADYGNRLSGVFNMKTRTPVSEKSRTSLALSFMNAKILSEGGFNNNKGSWQVLARRGYIDYILGLIGEGKNYKPVYYDILGKVQYFLNNAHYISVHFLASDDDFKWKDEDNNEKTQSEYGNIYGWLTWDAQFQDRLFAQSVLSVGKVTHDRLTQDYNGNLLNCEASDNRYFNFFGLKQDWGYEVSNNYLLKWGFDVKNYSADYKYYFLNSNGNVNNTYSYNETKFKKEGTETGFYLANRFHPFTALTAELGLRYDYASWTDDNKLSPRINCAYNLGRKTTFRIGWGKFYQNQSIHKLNIVDGDNSFYPAELSEHIVIGLEHEFNYGINLRVEGYKKKLTNIRPRYFNYRYKFDLTPENSYDRIRLEPKGGVSKGFEIYLFENSWSKHKWWISYAYSILEEKIDGLIVPRDMDQRHTINFDYSYRPDTKWTLNLSWYYHSGWPYTDQTVNILEQNPNGSYSWDWSPVALNGKRYPAYHRMDIRVNRFFETQNGHVSVFMEVRNLYNRKNIRQYNYSDVTISAPDNITFLKETEEWLPLIPSFGITWDF
jgi:outer membrane receptor for ferrienterochelin and colicin